ncbi:MAG: hypothetical protein AABY22_05930 [Nanoarchaeota archaeon]
MYKPMTGTSLQYLKELGPELVGFGQAAEDACEEFYRSPGSIDWKDGYKRVINLKMNLDQMKNRLELMFDLVNLLEQSYPKSILKE